MALAFAHAHGSRSIAGILKMLTIVTCITGCSLTRVKSDKIKGAVDITFSCEWPSLLGGYKKQVLDVAAPLSAYLVLIYAKPSIISLPRINTMKLD